MSKDKDRRTIIDYCSRVRGRKLERTMIVATESLRDINNAADDSLEYMKSCDELIRTEFYKELARSYHLELLRK